MVVVEEEEEEEEEEDEVKTNLSEHGCSTVDPTALCTCVVHRII